MVDALAVQLVGDGDTHLVQFAQHVEEHDGQLVGAVEGGGVARATASNQPQRRGRPVTVPYSRPVLRMRSPMPSGPSVNSVGKGPRPTRVE